MALRDQPYLPLYVQDYLTDEKLNSCSASSQGVYIKIMCILHKQTEYGCILLKQKDKQNSSKVSNFACKLAKLLPFDQQTIAEALDELFEEGVLIADDDKLWQKRMVKDGAISDARSKAGKSGGGNPNLYKQTPKQMDKQNPEYEYENKDEVEDVSLEVKAAKISKFEREQNFRNEVFEKHGEKYPAAMLDKFCSYWTESNPNGKKLKFEMQATFDIAKRLVTWAGNDFGNKRTALQKPDFAKGQSIF